MTSYYKRLRALYIWAFVAIGFFTVVSFAIEFLGDNATLLLIAITTTIQASLLLAVWLDRKGFSLWQDRRHSHPSGESSHGGAAR